jgi:hypothetical protein
MARRTRHVLESRSIYQSKEDLKVMIRITSKVKIASGIAAGALALGAAGAYAANANNTISVAGAPTITLPNGGPPLVSVDKKTLTVPTTFATKGDCISFFAKNRDFALAPTGGSTTVSKNYHGKLMSGLQSWCQNQVKATTKTDATETETPDAQQSSAPETDSTDTTNSGSSHGQGHGNGHGHGRQANETD